MTLKQRGALINLLLWSILFCPILLQAGISEQAILDSIRTATGARRAQFALRLAELYWNNNRDKEADEYFRSALKTAHLIDNKELHGEIHFAYGRFLYFKSRPDSALRYLGRALKIYESLTDSNKIGKCLSHLGLVYSQLGRTETAWHYLEKALAIQQAVGDKVEQGKILTNLGNIHRDLGDYQSAQTDYLKAIAIYRLIDDLEGLAWLNFSLGVLYRNIKDYPQAFTYLNESLKYYRLLADKSNTKNTGGIRICLSVIGDVYLLSGDYEKAREYLTQALELQRQANVPIAIAHGLRRMAQVYLGLKDYTQALDYARQSLAIQQRQSEKSGLPEIYGILGEIYWRLDQKGKAYTHLQKGLTLAHLMAKKPIEVHVLKTLAEFFYSYQQLDSAYKYLNRYTELRDQIFNEEVSSRIASLQAQYELKEGERLNKQLQTDILLKNMEIGRQKTWRNFMIITLSLTFLLAGLLVILYIKTRSDNQKIKEAMAKIKTLSGLIPICSHCKKIRNDRGYYEELEKYISEHSDAIFSHGICPDCLEKYYPEYTAKIKKRRGEISEQEGG